MRVLKFYLWLVAIHSAFVLLIAKIFTGEFIPNKELIVCIILSMVISLWGGIDSFAMNADSVMQAIGSAGADSSGYYTSRIGAKNREGAPDGGG